MPNQLLQNTKKKLEDSVPPKLKDVYDRIIVAGMKLMWSDQTHKEMVSYLERIKSPKDVPALIAHGIAKVIQIIITNAKIKPKLEDPFYPASMLAAQVLCMDALQYVEQKKKIVIDQALLAETHKLLMNGLFKMYGITEDLMRKALAHAQQQAAAKNPKGMVQSAPPTPGQPPVQPGAPV